MAGSDGGRPDSGQAPRPAGGGADPALLGLAVLFSLPLLADAVTVYGWGIYVYYLRAPAAQAVCGGGVLVAGGWPLLRRAGSGAVSAAAGALAYGLAAWAALGARLPGRYFIASAALILGAHGYRVAAVLARRRTKK